MGAILNNPGNTAKGLLPSLIIAAGLFFAATHLTSAADVPVAMPAKVAVEPAPQESSWAFRFTPYAWLTALDGSTTAKGNTVDIDASFIDIVEKTDTLVALMGYFEARNGRFGLFADIVFQKLGLDSSSIRSRNITPRIGGTLSTSLGLDIKMVTMEVGAAYEVLRWNAPGGAASFAAIDVMAGGRYWWQQAELNLSLVGAVNVGDLAITGGRALAKSGSVSWLDPFIGARFRYQIAPGKELAFTGDIGGFGVGSQFSWQLVGAYTWEFAVTKSAAWYGVIGYRALYVDYSQGLGSSKYEYDMLQHGPLFGVSMRF